MADRPIRMAVLAAVRAGARTAPAVQWHIAEHGMLERAPSISSVCHALHAAARSGVRGGGQREGFCYVVTSV
jgi:hypothetical protein